MTLWYLLPFVALAIAIPLAVRYERRARARWEWHQRQLRRAAIFAAAGRMSVAMLGMVPFMRRVAEAAAEMEQAVDRLTVALRNKP